MVPDDLEKRLLDEQFEEQIQAAEAAEAAGEPIPRLGSAAGRRPGRRSERREVEEPEVELGASSPTWIDQDPGRHPGGLRPDRGADREAGDLQRIREAERGMMFEEYKDRTSASWSTRIIRQSDNRYTLVKPERVEALLPRSEQVYNERYDRWHAVKAVITDASLGGLGPSIVVSRRNSG